jgi:hypothetical protein
LIVAPNAAAAMNVTTSPPMMTGVESPAFKAKSETMKVLATRPLRAKTSPWAKLISCRIP